MLQKHASALFRNASLEFYGVKSARIKELISVELPVIEVSKSAMDFVFLLEDDTYLHFEFQTAHSKQDLIRFAHYDLRLFERDGRDVQTVIIYSADVKRPPDGLRIGSLTYAPDVIMMGDYDGKATYAALSEKIRSGGELTDIDIMNLCLLPLMRNDMPRGELAVNSIRLALTVEDKAKRDACVASAVAFSERFLSEAEESKIEELLRMSNILVRYLAEKVEQGIEGGVEVERSKIAKSLLQDGMSAHAVSKHTGLDEETVRQIQSGMNSG